MLRDRFTELQDRLLSQVKTAQTLPDKLSFLDQVAEWHRTRRALPEVRKSLHDLRAGGFVWLPLLEQQLAEALALAPEAHAGLWLELDHSLGDLIPRVETVLRDGQSLAFQGDYETNAHRIDQFEAKVKALGSEVSLAVERAQAAVNLVRNRLTELEKRLKLVQSFAERIGASGIVFDPSESPIFALCTTWKDSPDGEAEGYLFLTSRRVCFLRDEDVKVKTGLFSSETHHVKALMLDAPLASLTAAENDSKGFFFTDQLLVLRWQVTPAVTTFVLGSGEGTSEFWDGVVEAIKSDSVSDLVVPEDVIAKVEEGMRTWSDFLQAHKPITEGPSQGTSREKILHDALVQIFTADALRRFLVLELDRSDLLLDLPPESASPAMFFFSTTVVFLQRGLVNQALTAALLRARPDQEALIAQAAQALGIA